jgi:hypothetical protein
MKEFDIQMSMNGVKSEINTQSSRFDGEVIDFKNESDALNMEKKSWIDELNVLTEQFKGIVGSKTPERIQAEREKELSEKGTKYKILGLNPFVAIGLSFGFILVGSYFVVKIKGN